MEKMLNGIICLTLVGGQTSAFSSPYFTQISNKQILTTINRNKEPQFALYHHGSKVLTNFEMLRRDTYTKYPSRHAMSNVRYTSLQR